MLTLISINDEPGKMLSKTGKKLNFEFSNIARYYKQTSFLRNPENNPRLNSVDVKYPKRLLDSKKSAQEPFRLAKGRDLDMEARMSNARAPPVGAYNPRSDHNVKTWRLYGKENPEKDLRDTFMNVREEEQLTPVKVEKHRGKSGVVKNFETDAQRRSRYNSSVLQSAIQSAHNETEKENKHPNHPLFRKGTINYWDQFKKQKQGVGLVDFDRQFGRTQNKNKPYGEYDLNSVELNLLSNHKKGATDVYFFNKANVYKKPRSKFVKKMNFYNVKLDIVRPKLIKMVPAFDREVGRRPLSVGGSDIGHVFYDYKKTQKRVPVIDFDKMLKI